MAQAHADTTALHASDPSVYYVPHSSRWPLFASVALFVTMFGLAGWFNEAGWGRTTFFVGAAGLAFILFKWFADVVLESVSGYYNRQVDVSFRMGMVWFIFSEVMFFAAFFGALFYTRQFALPWRGGAGDGVATNYLLWEGFSAAWPSAGTSSWRAARRRERPPWRTPFWQRSPRPATGWCSSKTPASCSAQPRTWSRCARRTESLPSPSWFARLCGFGPTGSRLAKSAAPRPSTCSRPGARAIQAVLALSTPGLPGAPCAAWNS